MPLDLGLACGEHGQQPVAARFTGRLSLLAPGGLGEPLADPLGEGHEEAVPEGSRAGPPGAVHAGAGEGHRMGGLHEQRGEQGVDGREIGLETHHRAEAVSLLHHRAAPIGLRDRHQQAHLRRLVGRLDPHAQPGGPLRFVRCGGQERSVDAVPGHERLRPCGEGLGLGRVGRRLRLRQQRLHASEHLGVRPADLGCAGRPGLAGQGGQAVDGLEAGQERGDVDRGAHREHPVAVRTPRQQPLRLR
jgi:hypothetical protein